MILFGEPLAKGYVIFGGIAVVLGKCYSKIVSAVEIGMCAHIYIIMFFGIEYGIDCGYAWKANRSRREASIHICIIWVVDFEVFEEDSIEFEVLEGVFDSWVALEANAFTKAVEIEACDA